MKKTVWGLLLTAAAVVAMTPFPAFADRGGYDRGHSHGHGHGHYGRHSEREWRSGSWHHGSHLGRSGWWWIVNGAWYPYAHRSSAYPVYQETVIIEQPVPVQQQPQTIIVQQPVQQPVQQVPQMQQHQQYQQQYQQQYPQTSTPPSGIQQPTANMWYYCDAARMYYPYVQTCASGWRAVPPVPPTGVIR